MDHQAVLEHVVEWAQSDHNIRASVLTGSIARDPAGADTEADLDVELYVTNPSLLLLDDTWYHQFGGVLVVEALENPGWHPTRLVYYAEGKIDFMVAPATVLGGGVEYDRPFRILIDKDGAARAFQRTTRALEQPPTPAEFLQCVHWFYAAAIMWAKYLARDDPWAARLRDWDSKNLLLTMLEWDHKARKGWDYDTWYLGHTSARMGGCRLTRPHWRLLVRVRSSGFGAGVACVALPVRRSEYADRNCPRHSRLRCDARPSADRSSPSRTRLTREESAGPARDARANRLDAGNSGR